MHRNFLVSDGDFDITTSEWRDLPKEANQLVPEDAIHFPFRQSRQFSFLHKRTTMLFIGPKNAPTSQTHYTLTDISRPPGNFGSGSISSVIFLIVSKFDGVPFSDCFKVLQYWVLERSPKTDSTHVTCGIGVNFHKSTMMRSKIVDGVKDEMSTQVRRLLASIINSVTHGSGSGSGGERTSSSSSSSQSNQPLSFIGGSSTADSQSEEESSSSLSTYSIPKNYLMLFDRARLMQIYFSVVLFSFSVFFALFLRMRI
jgi:hypothetical protein